MFDHISGASYFAFVDHYNWRPEFILIRELFYRALLLMNIYQIIGNTSVSSFSCGCAHIKLNVTLVQSTLLVGDSGTIYISVYVPLCYAILRLYSSSRSLTPILISRFLLNLRKVNRDTGGGLSSTSSRFSAMQFGNPVGTVSGYGDMSGLAWDDFPETQGADLGNNDIALVSISSIHTRSRP